MKDECDGKIRINFETLRPNMYSFLPDGGCLERKENGTKKCFIKRENKFEDYKNYLENNKAALRSQQRLRSELHNAFT